MGSISPAKALLVFTTGTALIGWLGTYILTSRIEKSASVDTGEVVWAVILASLMNIGVAYMINTSTTQQQQVSQKMKTFF